jgi:hypothetical protein
MARHARANRDAVDGSGVEPESWVAVKDRLLSELPRVTLTF